MSGKQRGRILGWILTGMAGIAILLGAQRVRSDDETVILTITRVRQIDRPDGFGGGDGDFYAKVRINGVSLPKTGHRDNRRDVSPNWTFRRGMAAGSSIPISIEIWDHDSTSRDDQCDVSPRRRDKRLDITYNPTSGRISGDVSGTRSALIHARGSGDSDRVEIWFRVTHTGGGGAPSRLPEVWAPNLKIKLLWTAQTNGTDLAIAENRLRGFNNRLYDCTDGQWRIARFLIHDANSELDKEGKGVGHVHRTNTHGPHGHADGRPNDPEHWHVNERSGAGTYLMEFLHSWTGLKDEYEKSQNGPSTQCPLNASVAAAADACVMWNTGSASVNELCRPQTHNPDTEQGKVRKMDCYSWLRKVMRDSGRRSFQVPRDHIAGPATAPRLRFVYVTVQRVRQIDNPDKGRIGGKDGDLYARVTMDGARFAKSKHRDDRRDVSPNWCFGLGYSSNTARSIPIRLEIWDHDGPFDGDDRCDINPRRGKRHLDLTYNPGTGRISGDATGRRNIPITVRGGGDRDRAEVRFMVTSR